MLVPSTIEANKHSFVKVPPTWPPWRHMQTKNIPAHIDCRQSSQNPDPISDQNRLLFIPLFRPDPENLYPISDLVLTLLPGTGFRLHNAPLEAVWMFPPPSGQGLPSSNFFPYKSYHFWYLYCCQILYFNATDPKLGSPTYCFLVTGPGHVMQVLQRAC